MDMTGIKVGDRVQVFDSYRRSDPNGSDGTVTKVGRRLFSVTLGWGRELVFRLENGHLNDKNFGYQTYVMTPEQVEMRNRLSHAENRLKELGLEHRQSHNRLTLDQMLRVIAVLEDL
jgi:hypothetical protein